MKINKLFFTIKMERIKAKENSIVLFLMNFYKEVKREQGSKK